MGLARSSHDIGEAVGAGLAYLKRSQLPSGEFQTFTGPSPDLLDSVPFTKSPYITTFVGHALSAVPDDLVVSRIRQRIGDFLEAEEEVNGIWNFQGRGEWRIPADLDTTACAAAALLTLGRRRPRELYALLMGIVRTTESALGGPYYTYIGINENPDDDVAIPFSREVDFLVNVNVVFLCGLLGIEVPGATAYLLNAVRNGVFSERSRYCISSHFQTYCLSRAYAEGNVQALASAVPAVRDHLLDELPAPEAEASAFHVACRAVGLLNLGVETQFVTPFVDLLLGAQESDGGWPIWAGGAGFPREWDWSWLERWPAGPTSADFGWCWGCRALVTGIAIEALSKWERRADGARPE